MNRIISATVAVALLAGAAPVAASATEFVRKTEQTKTVKELCEWKVDGKGAQVFDEDGNPIPITNDKGEQICVTETVSQPGSSDKLKWADESNRSLIIGTVLGVVGAIIAGVIGMSLLFIESIDIQLLPGLR